MVSRKSKTSLSGNEAQGCGDPPEGRMKPARDPAKGSRRERRKKSPLDETSLRDLALAYVARYATTGAKLEAYLARKLRERGVAEDSEGRTLALDPSAIAAQFAELGYVDDAAFARARARDLTGRGYGSRRVEQALWAAGVEEDTRADHAPGEAASRRAAMLLARKRRFGPFASDGGKIEDPMERRKAHEKQVAAMLRAGHLFDHVRFILDAHEKADIEEWVREAEDEDDEDGNGGYS